MICLNGFPACFNSASFRGRVSRRIVFECQPNAKVTQTKDTLTRTQCCFQIYIYIFWNLSARFVSRLETCIGNLSSWWLRSNCIVSESAWRVQDLFQELKRRKQAKRVEGLLPARGGERHVAHFLFVYDTRISSMEGATDYNTQNLKSHKKKSPIPIVRILVQRCSSPARPGPSPCNAHQQ